MPNDLIAFGEPAIHQDGMTFGFEWKRGSDLMCRMQFTDVRQEGDDLYANVTLWWLLDQPVGVRPIIPEGKVKLNSLHSTGWRTVGTQAAKRISNVDWDGALTVAVDHVTDVVKTGEPTTALFEKTRSTEAPFMLEPWISNTGVTTMYGEGGLSKSLITLAMGISVATGVPIFGKAPIRTGPVIIFDYEDDYQTHVDRLLAICRSFGIPPAQAEVYHYGLAAKVSSAHREMQRRVRETGAILGILDSVGMARGGSAVAAEDSIRLYRYLRAIDIPFLCIDHISKEAKERKGAADRDAFGSIYSMNSVRLGWSLQRQATNTDTIDIFAANTKHNHVPKQRPQTMSIRYRNDENGVPDFIDIEVGNDFGFVMEAVSPRDKIAMLLMEHDELTVAQISESLGIPASSVRRHLADEQQMDMPRLEQSRKVGNMAYWKNVLRSTAQGLGEQSVSSTDEQSEEG